MGILKAEKQRLGRDVFTTGQVAEMCGVAPRTVSKWIDAGKLAGHRLPLSTDRRVNRNDLIAFAADAGLTLKWDRDPLYGLEKTLLVKLGSIAVHADGLTGDDPRQDDRATLRVLLANEDVQEWLGAMRTLGFIPEKRS